MIKKVIHSFYAQWNDGDWVKKYFNDENECIKTILDDGNIYYPLGEQAYDDYLKQYKAEYIDNKFIVINTKIFDEMKSCACGKHEKQNAEQIEACVKASLESLRLVYKKITRKDLNQKYYVCNQDEYYAKDVIDIILKGVNNENK